MPVYQVDRPDQKPRVVDAKTPAAARAHVANDEITVTKIDTATAFKLAQDGAKLEAAGEETSPEGEREASNQRTAELMGKSMAEPAVHEG